MRPSRSLLAEVRGPRLAFAVSFVSCFALLLTWAAATPLFGMPDEISHMVRASAAVRGDLDGRVINERGDRAYRAPAILVPLGDPDGLHGGICYAGVPSQSPSCMSLTGDRSEKRILSTASGYPAVYYVLVGWPTLLSSGAAGLYGMRFASAAVTALMLALAITSLGVGRRWATAYVGLAVAATPMVWFVGASVNPSAAAISSAIAAWCGGHRLVHAEGSDGLRRFAWRFGLPLSLLFVLRRDSILWGGLVVLTLAVLTSRAQVTAMVRSRHVVGWGLVSVACAAFAWRTGVAQGSQFAAGASSGTANDAFGYLLAYLQQMVGVLGWLDTSLPGAAYLLWYLVFGALLIPALGLVLPRTAIAIVFVVVAVGIAIVVIGSRQFPYFQGRYALPSAVGVPLLAGLGLATIERSGRLPFRPIGLAIVAAALVHGMAFLQNLRRYALSGQPSWWLFGDTQWTPPTAPVGVLVIAHVVALAATTWWWLSRAHAAAS